MYIFLFRKILYFIFQCCVGPSFVFSQELQSPDSESEKLY